MSAQTTIDDRTADIIRSALGAAQAGRIKEACEIGERGLAEGGDAPTLHAMIGAFLCSAGDYRSRGSSSRDGEPRASGRSPDRPKPRDRAHRVRALRLMSTPVLTDAMVAGDQSGALRRLRGFAAQMSGDLPASISRFRSRLLRTIPRIGKPGTISAMPDSIPGIQTARFSHFAARLSLTLHAAPTRLNLARALRDFEQARRSRSRCFGR